MKADAEIIYDDPMIPVDPVDPVPIPPNPVGPGLPPELPEVPKDPVIILSKKVKKIIKDIVRTYYKENKKYGDLNTSYDAEKIEEIAEKVLAADGVNVDSTQLQTEIEGNILSGAYKLSTDNDIFVYLFIAGIAIAVYFYFKSKKT
jgi:hypothetical protein